MRNSFAESTNHLIPALLPDLQYSALLKVTLRTVERTTSAVSL